jgi:hypothetical protein
MIVQNYTTLAPTQMSNEELKSIIYQYEITSKNFQVRLSNGISFEMSRSEEFRYKEEQAKRLGIDVKYI